MKILITAPTSRLGRLVVRELLAPEFSVRVIVTDPAQLPEEICSQVEVISGGLDDPGTLQDALAGVEAVFFSLPPVSRWKTDGAAQQQRMANLMARAIRAARTLRMVTAWEVDNVCEPGRGQLADLQDLEDILNRSGAALRHIHGDGIGTKPMLPGKPALARGAVCRSMPVRSAPPALADIADVALRWLVRRDWSGIASVTVPGVATAASVNPEALAASRSRPGQCFWF